MTKKQLSTYTLFCLTLIVLSVGLQNVKAQEPLSVQIQPPTSASVTIFTNVQLVAQASGGTGEYGYQWYANDTVIENTPDPTILFNVTQTGRYNFKCIVTDTAEDSATSSTATISVIPKAASPGPLVQGAKPSDTPTSTQSQGNQDQTTTIIIIAAVAIVLIAAAILLVVRRRIKRPSSQ